MTKIHIMETVLRDGQQSQIATRMTTKEMLPVLKTLDEAGYHALEMWGGATFDSCLRFLNEDPWERLRTIRKHIKKTKLQMLVLLRKLADMLKWLFLIQLVPFIQLIILFIYLKNMLKSEQTPFVSRIWLVF